MSKKCSNKLCIELLPVFGMNKTKTDGLNNQCKACIKASAAQRYLINKQRYLARNRTYRQTNTAFMTAIKAEWRKRNPEQNKLTSIAYRTNNIEHIRELDRVQASKRRAWKYNAESDGSTLADLISLNPSLVCYLCSQPIIGNMHIDHVIPLARGGSDTIDNKELTHPFCNISKGAKIIERIKKRVN